MPNTDKEKQACIKAFNDFRSAGDRAKKALLDAAELLRQYKARLENSDPSDNFPANICLDLVTASPPRGFPTGATTCANETPEATINRFIEYYRRTVVGFGNSTDGAGATGIGDAARALTTGDGAFSFDQSFTLYSMWKQEEETLLVAALIKPYLFTLVGGRIVEQRFSPGVPVVAAAIQSTLGAAYQLSDAPPKADQWTASEYDATGEYQAEYMVAGDRGTVTKRKLLYKGVTVAGDMDSATRARVAAKIVGSSGELRITGGTLAAIRLEDAVEGQVLAKVPLTVQTKLAIDLDPAPPAPAASPDRAALLARTIAHPMGKAYGDGRANGLFDRARYDGRTFEQLLGELEAEARDTKAGELWQGRNGSPIPDAEQASNGRWRSAS